MAFLSTINIVGSGLTAQQLRLDIVAENVTNSTTTRTENDGGAYRRKMVVFQSETGPLCGWSMTPPIPMRMKRATWRCPMWTW